jgi:hypothetical protein
MTTTLNATADKIEVADVMRRFGPDYLERFGGRMLPSHRQAIQDIMDCRTAHLGGHAWHCQDCDKTFYVYHGCRNRSCPACHTRQTQEWLEKRQAELLPCPYYHVTVTIPEELRAVFRANQREAYDLLMRAAAEAVLELAADRRHMGALAGVLAVLHTWTARMDYHPHVHLLVSGGGAELDEAGQLVWRETRRDFFVHARLIARLVRGKLRAALAKGYSALHAQIPREVWKRDWVADCRLWGQGERAVLDYLARYVFRVAVTNRRIVGMDAETVSFRWKDREAGCWRTCRVAGQEFLRRFLQHVLPQGFHKVRYYGLWNPGKRELAAAARAGLELAALLRGQGPGASAAVATGPQGEPATDACQGAGCGEEEEAWAPSCPHCRSRKVRHLWELRRGGRTRWPDS